MCYSAAGKDCSPWRGRLLPGWLPDCWRPWEVFVEPKGSEDGQLRKAPVAAVPQGRERERAVFPWPWGLVAIGVMALAWVGIYLLWNGVAFLFSW